TSHRGCVRLPRVRTVVVRAWLALRHPNRRAAGGSGGCRQRLPRRHRRRGATFPHAGDRGHRAGGGSGRAAGGAWPGNRRRGGEPPRPDRGDPGRGAGRDSVQRWNFGSGGGTVRRGVAPRDAGSLRTVTARPAVLAGTIVAVLAGLVWIVQLATLSDLSGSDAAGNGMARAVWCGAVRCC